MFVSNVAPTGSAGASGSEIWNVSVGSGISTALEDYDNIVYAGTSDGSLVAIEPNFGKIKWSTKVGERAYSPLANEGTLYMPMGVIVPQENRAVEIYASGGEATISSLELYRLKSAW